MERAREGVIDYECLHCVFLTMTIKLLILSSPLTAYRKFMYPPGSKCKALRLGVHLILLSFIRISLLTPKIIFYFVGVGVGGGLFLSLNLLIIIWYIVYVQMYIYTNGIVAQQKSNGF